MRRTDKIGKNDLEKGILSRFREGQIVQRGRNRIFVLIGPRQQRDLDLPQLLINFRQTRRIPEHGKCLREHLPGAVRFCLQEEALGTVSVRQ